MTSYRALDATFVLEAPQRLGRVLRAAYVDLETRGDVEPEHTIRVERSLLGGWRTFLDGVPRERRLDESATMLDVRRAVNELAEHSAAATDAVLHASAIDIGGAVIVIVGPVVAGKSTLLLEAARRGHGYVADDVVAIRDDLTVRPFHRPVGVRREMAGELGVRVPRGPYRDGYPVVMSADHRLSAGGRLGLLVLARRADGLASDRHSPSWGLMMLANGALRAEGHERAMFQRLAGITAAVPVLSLWFDEAPPAVDLLERSIP